MEHAGGDPADLVEQRRAVGPGHRLGQQPLGPGRAQSVGDGTSGGQPLAPRPAVRRVRRSGAAQEPGQSVRLADPPGHERHREAQEPHPSRRRTVVDDRGHPGRRHRVGIDQSFGEGAGDGPGRPVAERGPGALAGRASGQRRGRPPGHLAERGGAPVVGEAQQGKRRAPDGGQQARPLRVVRPPGARPVQERDDPAGHHGPGRARRAGSVAHGEHLTEHVGLQGHVDRPVRREQCQRDPQASVGHGEPERGAGRGTGGAGRRRPHRQVGSRAAPLPLEEVAVHLDPLHPRDRSERLFALHGRRRFRPGGSGSTGRARRPTVGRCI